MTGLETLDRDLGGLFRGDLTVLAARPGTGKTALACQLAQHFADRGRRALFISLEMARVELANRIVCARAGVSASDVRTGRLHGDDLDAMREAADALAQLPLTVTDAQGLTVPDVRRLVRQAQRRDGCDVAIVDYLGRLTPTDPRLQRYLQIGEMTAGLKTLAVSHGVAVLCLAQLSRAAEGKGKGDMPPQLSHLRESGSIEQDADVVLTLHRDRAGKTTIETLKNRHGPVGSYAVTFEPSTMTFEASDGDEWSPAETDGN